MSEHKQQSIWLHHRFKMTYTNYRGETAERTVEPKDFLWGSTEWHPEPGMLMLAFDLEKQEDRLFAVKDIKEMVLV